MSDNLKEHGSTNSPEALACDACGADVSSEDTFCRKCGADITEASDDSLEGWECNACGADVSFEDVFCRKCGADITEASDDFPEGWECNACGADVSFEDAFCKNCNADITEAFDSEEEPKMIDAFTPLERNSIAACCGLSLLLFFFPLLTIHVPIAGDQDVSGYDVVSKLTEFRNKLKDSNPRLSLPSSSTNPGSQASQDLPLSVQLGWLIAAALISAFLSAAVTLIAAFKDVSIARATSAFGTCCSIVAIVHITIMSSDIRSWLSDSMQTTRTELKDNPFAGLAEGFGTLIANAFQVKPGWGLYALLLLSGVAAVLGFSRVLSRLRVVLNPDS